MRKGMTETNDIGHPNRNSSHYLRVGDLARQTGKTVRAIHLYEELGLLEPATRSSGGFPLYPPGAGERVRWVAPLHGLGLSLPGTPAGPERWWPSHPGPEAVGQVPPLFRAQLGATGVKP